MQSIKTHAALIAFNTLYIVASIPFFIARGNYEFMWYLGVMVAIGLVVWNTLAYTRFPNWVLWLLSLWGLLHVAGGGVPVGQGVLYAAMVWPVFDGGGEFVLFKYDQLVHAYGFGVAALAARTILERSMIGVHSFWVSLVAALVSMGLSVVNEIVEFIPVLTLVETGVGGYYNIALDLCFNTLGAVAGVVCYALLRRR